MGLGWENGLWKSNSRYFWVSEKKVIFLFEHYFKLQRNGIETAEVEKTVEPVKNQNHALNKAIFEFAMSEKEAICQETLNLFIEILATEVSNSALRFLPHSGIYLAGKIFFRWNCLFLFERRNCEFYFGLYC